MVAAVLGALPSDASALDFLVSVTTSEIQNEDE